MKNTGWIIVIVFLVAAIGGVYWYRTALEEPARLPPAPTGSALELIERIGRIKIDTAFFKDRSFLELVPQEPPALDIPRGNPNPFVAGEERTAR
ncbi:MAG: hypothetical protein A3C81_03120 [Candidatus Yanofskybacteria bacterium RIFCSPHIGHO2_02_FULL_46_19]|uniref:Uncharacterized protein n=1 Tax=Candidatus Yanofskybacteria bacterium RIFCSPHIGHO2_02_FULL_46_19 TaxID=1802684 RepID=A0A1F8FUF8_9BACT|nr:MAG: hypothetical protein A3C81_03120 [Candidatus Yanofskybacteria bacterium RIFCSPHIGHO2_02_FULL_46_19]